jgi:hypothetical protein
MKGRLEQKEPWKYFPTWTVRRSKGGSGGVSESLIMRDVGVQIELRGAVQSHAAVLDKDYAGPPPFPFITSISTKYQAVFST